MAGEIAIQDSRLSMLPIVQERNSEQENRIMVLERQVAELSTKLNNGTNGSVVVTRRTESIDVQRKIERQMRAIVD